MITLRIDIDRLRANIAAVKEHVKTRLYAVVKADAYGHGVDLCRYIEGDIYGFAVSCESEAAELVRLGIKKHILILSPSIPAIGAGNIIRTVCSLDDINKVTRHFRDADVNTPVTGVEIPKVALKINTGMNRLGATPSDTYKIVSEIKSRKDLILSDVFTHFYSVDGAEEQFIFFQSLTKKLLEAEDNAKNSIITHCCAGNCLKLSPKMHLGAVRCGLPLYGYGAENAGLKPVLSAFTDIEQINYVKKGGHIGYGEYTAAQDMRIAVIRAGYADGYRSVCSRVKINGKICRIVGKICMDLCMADITGLNVKRGDKAWLLCDEIDASAMTENMSPYETLTAFSGKRIRREYMQNHMLCQT